MHGGIALESTLIAVGAVVGLAFVWLTMSRRTRPEVIARRSARRAETRERESRLREQSELGTCWAL